MKPRTFFVEGFTGTRLYKVRNFIRFVGQVPAFCPDFFVVLSMRVSRGFFSSLLFGAVFFVAPGTSLHAETLEQAVQMTLQNHPSIEAAKAGTAIAGQEKREYRSDYFPQLAVSGQGGRIYGDNSTSRGLVTTRGAAYSNYWEGSLTARQMLFDGFETSNRVEAAQAKMISATMSVADTEERLAFSMAQAYLDLLRARHGLGMLEAHAAKVADYRERIKKMVDDGAADEAEHQQARDISVILENMIADYRGQVLRAEAYYEELTGALPAGEMHVPSPRSEFIPQAADEAVAYAIANHPALKSAEMMEKSAEHGVKAEEAGLYPEVDGEFSYLESEKKDEIGGEMTDGRAVVRMNWDFDTGGAQLARIQKKVFERKETQSRLHELERQVERTIRLSYGEYKTALEQAESQQKRLELNQKLFDTYKIQFEGARISLLQLMQSDNQMFTTQLEKMSGAYRILAAQYAILTGQGRLRESLAVQTAQAQPSAPRMTGPLPDEQK